MVRFFRALIAALILCLAATLPARATITSTSTKVVAACNGVTTNFSFAFVGVSASDIVVTLTNSSGVATVLTATQYTLTLNSPGAGVIWGVGGTVVYPSVGSPCVTGSTITITRSLPYTQVTPFANQGVNLPSATETSLDLLTMQVQQLNTLFTGALVQPVTDTQGFSALPGAAARANLALCFDATGYVPTACSVPASGTVSSALQPVLSAGSLAAGRTAFGLLNGATNNAGYGLQTGVNAPGGNAQFDVNFAQTQDSTNQSVAASFHLNQRICSGPVTYTLPRGNTLWNGFGFWIVAAAGTCTITPNANDNFPGVASGGSVAIPNGSVCYVSNNAASSALWQLECNGQNPVMAASATSSALTLTLSAPAIAFRDTTLANGDPVWAIPAATLAVTIPSGATLGTSNGVPFRVWVFVAYNSGTPVLGVATCSTASAIYPCLAWETLRKSGTAITAGATSAGTLYTASSVTNDAVRIIGYAEYSAGLVTAGTWASGPTTLQICLPPFHCKMPGDLVQKIFNTKSTADNSGTSSTYANVGASQSITPSSAPNLIFVRATGNSINSPANGVVCTVKLMRGGASGTQFGGTVVMEQNIAAGALLANAIAEGFDLPGATSSQTYQAAATSSTGSACIYGNTAVTPVSTITLDEIMGALPANDNRFPFALPRAA